MERDTTYNALEHAHVEWSDSKLDEEVTTVTELLLIPHGEQRLGQLATRMSLAKAEQKFRRRDARGERVNRMYLFGDV